MKIKKCVCFWVLIVLSAMTQASASGMKILTCNSDKVSDDGQPYHKWQAVFDSSQFSKGQLKYELTEWHAEKSRKDGDTFIYPLKVTPTELHFFESMIIGRSKKWFSTVVDRKTLSYGGKHSPPTQSGNCVVKDFGNAI